MTFRTMFVIRKCSKLYCALFIPTLVVIIFLSRNSIPHLDYNLFFYDNEGENYVEPKICDFPELDPKDPTILTYIKHPPPLVCEKIQPDLTYVDYDGYLRYNETELNSLNDKKIVDVRCDYRTFDRKPGSNDNDLQYDEVKTLLQPVQLIKDMVHVNCSSKNSNGQYVTNFYWNLHAHPSIRYDNYFPTPTENQLSILLMTIDSMSYSAFKRNMPLTYDYVTKKMNMFMMESFNKIGENTQPVMIPAFTGKRLFTEQRGMPGEIEWFFGLQVKSDNLPLISKRFAEKGYATMFNEDRPDISIFSFNQFKGFTKKIVDFYYHSYWQAVQNSLEPERRYNTYCLRSVPVGDVFIDITKRHLTSMRNNLQFIFTAFNYYSHDEDGVRVENADQAYAQFWQEMTEGDYLNKTVVIFMSDHGHRFAPIRQTLVGLAEERNPFLGVWFPEWFYKRHRHIETNLHANKKRLISAYDIHETLLDILNANYDGTQRGRKSRGLSLLYQIPEERTCTEAGIPRQYCMCFQYQPLDVSSEYLQVAATTVVNHLNILLNSYSYCHRIKLVKILRAEKSKKIVVDNKHNESEIRIVIETNPNRAIFEALLERTNGEQRWLVKGQVQRLTAYKNTADCMKDKILRKYCTCNDQKTT